MRSLVLYNPDTMQIRQIIKPAPPRDADEVFHELGFSTLRTTQDVSGATHHVVSGQLHAKPQSAKSAEAEAQAWRTLRADRHERLSRQVDTINAVRWDGMTGQQRTAWKRYRQALLDMPENTTNPASPVWPEKPGD